MWLAPESAIVGVGDYPVMPTLSRTADRSQQVAISIVSHLHGHMVEGLIKDLLQYPEVGQVVVTKNTPELLTLPPDPRIVVVDNATPAGFASNQNAAFTLCRLPYFCALNPDIQLQSNPFPSLLAALETTDAAIAAPLVKNPFGTVEDSIRSFPTFCSLLRKAVRLSRKERLIIPQGKPFYPDWVAGMFMLFRSDAFRQLDGFDEGFFLYYEDVDICVRVWQAGMKVIVCPSVSVVHDARRESHKKFRFLHWHLASMLRYFYKRWGRLPSVPRQQ